MNSVHDCGGMAGLGSIPRLESEPTFAAEWERRVFGIMWLINAKRLWTADESRFAIERMPAIEYLDASYYERWLFAISTLLVEKAVFTAEELEARRLKPTSARGAASPLKYGPCDPSSMNDDPERLGADGGAKFAAGDVVRTINSHPHGHTRLPRYARDKVGMVLRSHGVYPLPDETVAGTPRTQHVYLVQFPARTLWGESAGDLDSVRLDLWEDYIHPAAGQILPT